MIKIKAQASTQKELAEVARALKALGVVQRGPARCDGFSFNGKFATDTKNDEKTKG